MAEIAAVLITRRLTKAIGGALVFSHDWHYNGDGASHVRDELVRQMKHAVTALVRGASFELGESSVRCFSGHSILVIDVHAAENECQPRRESGDVQTSAGTLD